MSRKKKQRQSNRIGKDDDDKNQNQQKNKVLTELIQNENENTNGDKQSFKEQDQTEVVQDIKKSVKGTETHGEAIQTELVPNGRAEIYGLSDGLFILAMFICIISICVAVAFLINSISISNQMIDPELLNTIEKSLDSESKISLDAYLHLQMQLQEIRGKALQTNTLTFLYQLISGTLIGVAGYFIKISTEKTKELDKMEILFTKKVNHLENKANELEAKLSMIESDYTKIDERLLPAATFSYVNRIATSVQTYTLFSEMTKAESDENKKSLLEKQQRKASRRVYEDIKKLANNVSATMERIKGLKSRKKVSLLTSVRNEFSALGTIIDPESVHTDPNIKKWDSNLKEIHYEINGALLKSKKDVD